MQTRSILPIYRTTLGPYFDLNMVQSVLNQLDFQPFLQPITDVLEHGLKERNQYLHHPAKDLTSDQAQLIQLGNLVAIGYHTSLDLIIQHLLFQVDQLNGPYDQFNWYPSQASDQQAILQVLTDPGQLASADELIQSTLFNRLHHSGTEWLWETFNCRPDQLAMAISGQLLTQPIVSLQLPANPSFKNILRDWRCVNQHLKTVALSRTVSRHGCIVTAENWSSHNPFYADHGEWEPDDPSTSTKDD